VTNIDAVITDTWSLDDETNLFSQLGMEIIAKLMVVAIAEPLGLKHFFQH